eukprot:Skav212851  [mRNA]  locus=scaffold325:250563:257747:+ [translate_table: standard]
MLPGSLFCKEQDRGPYAWHGQGSSFFKEKASSPCCGDLRERALEVASTCATESEATTSTALPASLIDETWKKGFAAFSISNFPPLDGERFVFDHILRPAADGLHAQIEVYVDRVAGLKVVGKRFPRLGGWGMQVLPCFGIFTDSRGIPRGGGGGPDDRCFKTQS